MPSVPVTDSRSLYGLPLERFVAERAALQKELRASGDRERAAQVSKLRKPSVAAWAVNQLVRTQRRAVAELFDAGHQLQRAQSELLEGRGDGHSLREAAERERVALERLSDVARGLLTAQGHGLSAAMLERVRDTLHAAALDEEARAQVADGCLEHDLRHVGIGDGQAPRFLTEPPSKRPSAAARTPPARRHGARGRPSDTEVERERAERLKTARKAAAEARRAAERTARDLRAAQARRDRAAEALDAAEAALAAARERAEQAALGLARTQKALTEPLA